MDNLPYDVQDIPEPIESQSFEFYRHPEGDYIGTIGELKSAYKDVEGKKCTRETPGAQLNHLTLHIYIQRYLGTAQEPKDENVLGANLIIPSDSSQPTGKVQTAKLYYSMYVSIKPKEQWKNVRMFGGFIIGKDDSTRVIQINPTNPGTKMVVFKNIARYYGAPVKFTLAKSDKGNIYIEQLVLLNAAWSKPEEIARVANEISELVKKEKEWREQIRNKIDDDIPPNFYTQTPEDNLDDILGEYEN